MDKVLFVAPIYRQYPLLVHALQLQTHHNWELMLVHDGPGSDVANIVSQINEPRVRYYHTPVHTGNYGHAVRDWALNTIVTEQLTGDCIVITNVDNYYVPGFIELMLPEMEGGMVAAYCSTLHNYVQWAVLDSQLIEGQIDGGCILVARDAALTVGWKSRRMQADWDFIETLIRRYGSERIRKVPRVLFVHN